MMMVRAPYHRQIVTVLGGVLLLALVTFNARDLNSYRRRGRTALRAMHETVRSSAEVDNNEDVKAVTTKQISPFVELPVTSTGLGSEIHEINKKTTATVVNGAEIVGNKVKASTGMQPDRHDPHRVDDKKLKISHNRAKEERGGAAELTKKKVKKVQQISIIGERNSGTTWTTAHLINCFGDDVQVLDRLVRYKHWFQHDTVPEKRNNSTLVIAQFRNPYHWIEGMRAKPHHSPMHSHVDWRTYVTTPWTMPRTHLDEEYLRRHGTLLADGSYDDANVTCKAYYRYHQINSCLDHPFGDDKNNRYGGYFEVGKEPGWSGYKPSYEMRNDGSGEAYGSVVDMRADKIRNYFTISEWDWIAGVKMVQYEELVRRGTSYLIKYVERMTGLKAKCKAYPAQNRPQRELDQTFVKWMNSNVDWKAEKLIGYEPME